MERIKDFFSKPKHLYFSVILTFVLVLGLASVSFSYVNETGDNITQREVYDIDTRIFSDELKDGKISLMANEARTFTVNVISNNAFASKYILNYTAEGNVEVSVDRLRNVINPYDVHSFEMTVANYNSSPTVVTIGLDTGYENSDIKVTGKYVVEK